MYRTRTLNDTKTVEQSLIMLVAVIAVLVVGGYHLITGIIGIL